jgi:hypothetical protein
VASAYRGWLGRTGSGVWRTGSGLWRAGDGSGGRLGARQSVSPPAPWSLRSPADRAAAPVSLRAGRR